MIFVLTGAGMSAESGLGTFRDKGGIWSRFDLAEVATPEGFAADPALVHDFYNARRANLAAAAPNAAHDALARLETSLGDGMVIVTQNVDDLHERAGSSRVIHMHGELRRALCHACGARWDAPDVMQPDDPCPACTRPASRPDVVWFGEIPYHMETIADALDRATAFVAIGTSGSVYPAAGFVAEAATRGIPTLELNLERSEISDAFDRTRLGPAATLVPEWVAGILSRN